ncbi:DUF397 domain-containing protein [Paractinoplanes toevensis]|uniref:DUF397 domain-containing protein n=1 Tax=Paractinoplanes toevensis TaxID=571911 RepID=A0A919T748_9ACTN|nr:DUF397 domain-containing protein [Actinoplanes toevensis]GIM90240.1 hypothetical protein Ato02nite_020330 [Actinoplanes toevensis]
MDDLRHLTWRKSRRSSGGACVEVAESGDSIHVRDSKDPAGPVLTFGRDAWRVFVGDVRKSATSGRQ